VSLIEDTASFKRFNGSFTNVPFPGCEQVRFKSAAYYECYARHLSITLHHIVGACAIGKVVDNELRVKGIRNLRVIDASVMPVVPVGTFVYLVAKRNEKLYTLENTTNRALCICRQYRQPYNHDCRERSSFN